MILLCVHHLNYIFRREVHFGWVETITFLPIGILAVYILRPKTNRLAYLAETTKEVHPEQSIKIETIQWAYYYAISFLFIAVYFLSTTILHYRGELKYGEAFFATDAMLIAALGLIPFALTAMELTERFRFMKILPLSPRMLAKKCFRDSFIKATTPIIAFLLLLTLTHHERSPMPTLLTALVSIGLGCHLPYLYLRFSRHAEFLNILILGAYPVLASGAVFLLFGNSHISLFGQADLPLAIIFLGVNAAIGFKSLSRVINKDAACQFRFILIEKLSLLNIE
jgi:hypothetical protein